jgi:hypothetical protein
MQSGCQEHNVTSGNLRGKAGNLWSNASLAQTTLYGKGYIIFFSVYLEFAPVGGLCRLLDHCLLTIASNQQCAKSVGGTQNPIDHGLTTKQDCGYEEAQSGNTKKSQSTDFNHSSNIPDSQG